MCNFHVLIDLSYQFTTWAMTGFPSTQYKSQDQRRATYVWTLLGDDCAEVRCAESRCAESRPALCVHLSVAESPGCPVWFPVANYLSHAMPALPAGRERHNINQVVYVLNLRSWDPCQSCICVCGPTRHQCYKYWHSGIGRVRDISKPMLKELHPHGLMH